MIGRRTPTGSCLRWEVLKHSTPRDSHLMGAKFVFFMVNVLFSNGHLTHLKLHHNYYDATTNQMVSKLTLFQTVAWNVFSYKCSNHQCEEYLILCSSVVSRNLASRSVNIPWSLSQTVILVTCCLYRLCTTRVRIVWTFIMDRMFAFSKSSQSLLFT